MKKGHLLFLCGLILLSLSACYYDHEETLYGASSNQPCTDTAGTVSYAQKVVPILQSSCYSCHTGSFPSGNQLMGTYTADKAMAQNGKLLGTINHAAGFSPMPKSAAKLSSCKIATIKKWVDAGMPNN
jgi:mono/diheme cytochrome c family protein